MMFYVQSISVLSRACVCPRPGTASGVVMQMSGVV